MNVSSCAKLRQYGILHKYIIIFLILFAQCVCEHSTF